MRRQKAAVNKMFGELRRRRRGGEVGGGREGCRSATRREARKETERSGLNYDN